MTRLRRLLSAALLAALAGCSREAPPPAAAPPAIAVPVATAAERPLERVITVSASLFAQERTPVSARVAGRVQALPVDLGAAVRAGEIIAEIEPRDYELRVQQSRALLGQARARLGLPLEGDDDTVNLDEASLVKEARAVLTQARGDLDRVTALSRQGIASTSDLEVATAAFTVAQSRHEDALEEARTRAALLQQRRAEHELARKQLADTRITAPFDGVVSERIANLGEHLEVGAAILTLVKADPLRLRAEVPERDAARVAAGQAVRVHLTGDTNVYLGAIRRLSPALNAASRMLVVEADVPARGALRPGAFARTEIVVDAARPGLVVPPGAVVSFAGVERVFVVEDGKAAERRITTGDRGPGWVEVMTGLKAGETVVAAPGGLVAGQPVIPQGAAAVAAGS
jgi:RND family efflux transporter MFP subunit